MSMFDSLPKDTIMLLSFTNTQLRDTFHTLDSFCTNFQIERETLIEKLKTIDYEYDEKTNQFV